jgi:hypothetical protein
MSLCKNIATTALKTVSSEVATYKFNGLQNVYHIEEWPLYNDWLKICKDADPNKMTSFHDTYLVNLNHQLLAESQAEGNEPMTFYDRAWRYKLKLNYDPYKKFMTQSARDIVSDGGPTEAMVWFAKQPATIIDPLQIVFGVNTLLITRKLNEAHLALALFKDLPFNAAAKWVGSDIFREVLMTGDIVLIHKIWLLGALQDRRAIELADAACFDNGWVPFEAVEWYKVHRGLLPTQTITGRYEYLGIKELK